MLQVQDAKDPRSRSLSVVFNDLDLSNAVTNAELHEVRFIILKLRLFLKLQERSSLISSNINGMG